MRTNRIEHLEVSRTLRALREAMNRELEAARERWEAELEPKPAKHGESLAERVADRLRLC